MAELNHILEFSGEQINRNATTTVAIPDLTARGLLPSKISFQPSCSEIEVDVMIGGLKICNFGLPYFSMDQNIYLEPYNSVISSGKEISLRITNRHRRQIKPAFQVTYSDNPGLIIKQEVTTELDDVLSTLQDSRPIQMVISSNVPIASLTLTPKFVPTSDSTPWLSAQPIPVGELKMVDDTGVAKVTGSRGIINFTSERMQPYLYHLKHLSLVAGVDEGVAIPEEGIEFSILAFGYTSAGGSSSTRDHRT